jgi:hypothetical protein
MAEFDPIVEYRQIIDCHPANMIVEATDRYKPAMISLGRQPDHPSHDGVQDAVGYFGIFSPGKGGAEQVLKRGIGIRMVSVTVGNLRKV